MSPFSRYFDDWLLNLKEILAEFETNPDVTVDEVFVKERERIIAKIEEEFNGAKQREATLNESVKELADKNQQPQDILLVTANLAGVLDWMVPWFLLLMV